MRICRIVLFNAESRVFQWCPARMGFFSSACTQPSTTKPTSTKLVKSTGRGAWNISFPGRNSVTTGSGAGFSAAGGFAWSAAPSAGKVSSCRLGGSPAELGGSGPTANRQRWGGLAREEGQGHTEGASDVLPGHILAWARRHHPVSHLAPV